MAGKPGSDQFKHNLLPVLAPVKPTPISLEHALSPTEQTGWLASWVQTNRGKQLGEAAASSMHLSARDSHALQGLSASAKPAQLVLRVWTVMQLAHLHPRVFESMLPYLVGLPSRNSLLQQNDPSTAVSR